MNEDMCLIAIDALFAQVALLHEISARNKDLSVAEIRQISECMTKLIEAADLKKHGAYSFLKNKSLGARLQTDKLDNDL